MHRQIDTPEFQRFNAFKFNFVEFLKVFFDIIQKTYRELSSKTKTKAPVKRAKKKLKRKMTIHHPIKPDIVLCIAKYLI